MHIEKYISFLYRDGNPESRYQLVTDKAADAYSGDYGALRLELIAKFSGFLCDRERDLKEKYAFLSYHEHKYKGAVELFLDFVKWSYKGLWHEAYDVYVLHALRDSIKPVAKGWLRYRGTVADTHNVGCGVLDPRIKVMVNQRQALPADYIRSWFKERLLTKNEKGEQIMEEGDFDLFIRCWFSGTGEPATTPPDRLLKTNATGAYLKSVIYQFYEEHIKETYNHGLRQRMVELLPVTFRKLQSSKVDTISKSLKRRPKIK